jgi:hypothetical protein
VGDWFYESNVTNHVHRSRFLHPPPGKGDLEPLPFLRQKLDVVIIGSRSHRLRLQALASKGDKPLNKYGSIAEDCTVKLPEVDLRKLLERCETKLLGGGLETMLLVTMCVCHLVYVSQKAIATGNGRRNWVVSTFYLLLTEQIPLKESGPDMI